MNPSNLGLLLYMGRHRGDLILHLLDAEGEFVVFVEQLAKLAVSQFQLVDAVFQGGKFLFG